MSGKADFSPDEWSKVLASPMVAGTAITAADPSGLWGLLKEGMAGGWALFEAKQNANVNPLVKAVAEDFAEGADARALARDKVQAVFKDAQAADLKRRAVDELRSVATLLDAKAPQDPSSPMERSLPIVSSVSLFGTPPVVRPARHCWPLV